MPLDWDCRGRGMEIATVKLVDIDEEMCDAYPSYAMNVVVVRFRTACPTASIRPVFGLTVGKGLLRSHCNGQQANWPHDPTVLGAF